ncbi:NACHT and WD repeat domain-containing protein 2 [Patella vulgata]|uniref:NACHT and WD repeat domain-containing protein 2 n=1 Tax=Patella vulgata TaxID=6465 RepID=UPI0021807525|nr:NACHT and WD repeat domain-containing protein 2 [Patella vulgata]XP_050413119.1 NACHT and WD repeat domain-containing protein 2 [Patella vulgata]
MAGGMEERAYKVLTGTFSAAEKPKIPAEIVRVYLASNGTDSVTERTSFIQNVYPRLREYCRRQYGVEFQVVDLEWGLPPYQSLTDDFKQREIIKCQTMSSATTLIVFIGQKYGNRVLPTSIPADEFEKIKYALLHNKRRETRRAFLLDIWFIKDENNIPAVYIPTKVKLDDIKNSIQSQNNFTKDSYCPETMEEIEDEILRQLERGTKLVYEDGCSRKDNSQCYRLSDLEKNLQIGLDFCDNLNDKCILILRKIIDLHNYVEDNQTPEFIELQFDEIEEELKPNEESQIRLEMMKSKVMGLIGKDNTLSYNVLWRYNDVINAELHTEYLNTLCDELYGRLKVQIDTLLPPATKSFLPTDELAVEVSKHWTRCFDVAGRFYGGEDVLNKVYDYLRTDSSCLFILHGPSGSGKTKFLSKIATDTYGLLGGNTITIIRFIGYTVVSSTARQLLYGICCQIYVALGLDTGTIPVDLNHLQRFMHHLLNNIPQQYTLVIYLDSIDQLHSEADDRYAWIPDKLPLNVKLIVSCYSEYNPLTTRLFKLAADADNFIQMTDFKPDDCAVLLFHFLNRVKRTITDKQLLAVKHVFEKCSSPIFVKLLAHELKSFKSFTEVDQLNLPTNIEEALKRLLTNLENLHGRVFVGKCLGYLVSSNTGLSDSEMEDILSLDEEVLDDVYRDYQPPIRRISPAKWLYLKDNIEGFLYSYDTDGVTVNMVKHACFIELIKRKYLYNIDIIQKQHSVLADFFLGSWSGIAKPVNSLTASERYVIAQPLTFDYSGLVRFNKRKYDQLPRHLNRSGRLDELNRLIFFNYQWLYNKIKSLSLEHIIEDFVLNPSQEASLVKEALKQSQSTIKDDIDNLGPELIGRLLPYYWDSVHIRRLIEQCKMDGCRNCAFIPNIPYTRTAGSALKSTITCPVVPEYFAFVDSDKYLICKAREDSNVYIYNVSTGKCKDNIFASNGDLYTTPNGQLLIIVDHITEAVIKVHDTKTGTFIGQIIPQLYIDNTAGESYSLGPVSLSNDTLCVIAMGADCSYLCIADLVECQVVKMIWLDGKATFCHIKPDYRQVFCNCSDTLLGYDLITYFQTCNIQLEFNPKIMVFSHDASLVYVGSTESTTVVCIKLSNFTVDLLFKLNVRHELNNHPIQDICVARDNLKVLVRGKYDILVYDEHLMTLYSQIKRPSDIPEEFKLPKSHFQELVFTDAQFSSDSSCVLAVIFRAVYIWRLEGEMVTTVQAPVGMITSLLVAKHSQKFVTHTDGSAEIQVWSISNTTVNKTSTEKLTGKVKKIVVDKFGEIAYVQCDNSDEIGIINMKSGLLIGMLTHTRNVVDFMITPTGKYLLVTINPRLSNSAVNIWDTEKRKVIKEFGNAVVKCVPCHEREQLYYMCQNEISYEAPYFLHSISFENSKTLQIKHSAPLKYILDDPFITSNDCFLVVLTADGYQEKSGQYANLEMCVFDLQSNLALQRYTPDTISSPTIIQTLIALRPYKASENTVAIIYKSGESKIDDTDNDGDGSATGLCLFHLNNQLITKVFHPLPHAVSREMVASYIFSNDFTFCLTDKGTLVHLEARKETNLRFTVPCILCVNDTVVVYCNDSILYAIRLTDKTRLGKCKVHSTICYLKQCPDDSVILVGCTDGAVLSYTLSNEGIGDTGISWGNDKEESGRKSITWDKLHSEDDIICSRPPTVTCHGPQDKTNLDQIKPLPQMLRPVSACSTHSVINSKTCVLM